MIKIKENFVDPFLFVDIKKQIMGKYFPWFYNDCKIEDAPFKCKTAILYINTNNGITIFETGEEIKSEENKIVMFPSNLKHTGTTHTDEKVRVVLNINYF